MRCAYFTLLLFIMVRIRLSSVIGAQSTPNVKKGRKLRTQAALEPEEHRRQVSQWKTWCRVHREENGAQPVLPLQPESVEKIGMRMKALGYRSTPNYIMTAKKMHIRAGHHVTDNLALKLKEVNAAVVRRLGPQRTSQAFDMGKLAVAAQLMRGPATAIMWPHLVMSIGTFLMMRTAEVGALNAEDVNVDVINKRATVRVSSSKTDPTGKGMKMGWCCMCSVLCWATPQSQAHVWLKCPYHCILAYAQRVHNFTSGREAKPVGGKTPFFMKKNGTRIVAADVAHYLKKLSEVHDIMSEDDVRPSHGYGGHSMRRTGVQFWYKMGMPADTIRQVARWRSKIIESYLSSAAVANIGVWTLQQRQVCREHVDVEHVVQRALAEMRLCFAKHLSKEKESVKEKTKPPALVPAETLVLSSTNIIHVPTVMMGPSTQFRARCGYKFGVSRYTLVRPDEASKYEACKKGCYKQLAAKG